tara:strand:- start:3015 stop:3134 length:120 start_codon:yes stop_codon:yes gene_type:complete
MNFETLARNILGKKLINLIKDKPYNFWDWESISRNPNIT